MNERIQKQIDLVVKSIEARTQSEKLLILATIIAGLFLAYLTYGHDPLIADIERIDRQIASTEQRIAQRQVEYAEKVALSQEDPNRFANDRLQVVLREQQRLDQEISSLAGDLVTPNEMTQILISVLEQQSGLDLVSFQNQPATPLRTGVTDTVSALTEGVNTLSSAPVTGQVYEHGLEINFRGDFFSTLRYLRYLEEITGSFFWDGVSFRITEWPQADVNLVIHTLSTQRGFIGV